MPGSSLPSHGGSGDRRSAGSARMPSLPPPVRPVPSTADMTVSRRITRAVAALAGSAAIATTGLLGLATAQAATPPASPAVHAADPAPSEADLNADVALQGVTPATMSPGGTLTLSGTVTNTGAQTLERPQALLRYSLAPLDSRDQIDRVHTDPAFRTGSRPGAPYHEFDDDLRPGDSARFSLEVPVDDLALSRSGVYVIGIEIRADDTSPNAATSRFTVAASRTVVPYLTEDEPLPRVPVATVWGLESQPRITMDRSLVNDDLAGEIATDGRLGRLMRAGADAPVTWLIDPDLLRTVEMMGTDYTVGMDDDAVPGAGGSAASSFWQSLAAAGHGGQTLLEPLADPDIESFVDTEPHLAEQLITTAVAESRVVAGQLASGTLPPQSDTSGSTPPQPTPPQPTPEPTEQAEAGSDGQADGSADQTTPGTTADTDDPGSRTGRTDVSALAPTSGPVVRVADPSIAAAAVDVYAEAGVEQLVLSPDSVESTPTTPFASVPTGSGSMDVVVTDHGLDTALTEASGNQDAQHTATRLGQRWRAETVMIALTAQRDDTTPDPVVAAPPAVWNPSTSTLAALVDVWTNTPWIHPATVSDLERPASVPDVDVVNSPTVGALPIANVSATSELAATADHFTSMFSGTDADDALPYGDLDTTVLRSASRSWRPNPGAGLQYTSTVDDRLTADINQVTLSVPEQVTLSSSTGVFPLTVDNPLDHPVSVRIAVSSANPDRLRVESVSEHTVREGTRATVNVEAEAFSNGRVPVRVGLVAADGTALHPEQRTVVNATDYGAFGWAVVAVGMLLLALSVGRRAWRRRHPRADSDAVLADMEVGLEPDERPHRSSDEGVTR